MSTDDPIRLREGYSMTQSAHGVPLVRSEHQCEICRRGPHPDTAHHAFQPATLPLRKARKAWRL